MLNQQAKQWIDHWNYRFPQLLEALESFHLVLSEQLDYEKNYHNLRNCMIKNYVKDILESPKAKIYLSDDDFNETLSSIAEVFSESLNILYPIYDTEFPLYRRGGPSRAWMAWGENKLKTPGRPSNPNSIPSIIQSQAGYVVMFEKCLTVYKMERKIATNTQCTRLKPVQIKSNSTQMKCS